MIEKILGKIEKVSFGFGGYQESCIGLSLTFSFGSGRVSAFIDGGWNFPPDENCKWTLEGQVSYQAKMVNKIISTLKDAKVDDVAKLAGKPVEVTLDGNMLSSWRILTEVL